MELSRPLRVVTAALDGDLLAVLAAADVAFTGRELAAQVGASHEGARRALARLVVQGIVLREPAGAAHLYRLNRDHLAAPSLVALAHLRTALLQRFRDRFAQWSSPPAYAALFGSAARGEERADSDLDVCVVRPASVAADDSAWRAQIAALEADGIRWTGNDVRVLELAGADLPPGTSDTVVDDVLRDGVTLFGNAESLRALRRPRRRTRSVPSAG